MATDTKLKKNWQGEDHHISEFTDVNCAPFQDFLRNIWGNYFYNRQNTNSEDQIDSINKIVGMMKAQIKLMILSETKQKTGELSINQDFVKETEIYNTLRTELSQVKQELEDSKMKEQQLMSSITAKDKLLKKQEQENNRLKSQLQEYKEARNRANQQIIMLSSRCYELQRFNTVPCSSFLDQYSAKSVQNESQNEQRPRVSLFDRKNSKILETLCEDTASIHSEQDLVEQKVELHEINMNLPPKNKNPYKRSLSLQCNYKDEINEQSYSQYLHEMKLVKLKTQRMIEMANERAYQRGVWRKTFEPYADRASFREMASPISILKDKRFKRIR